MGRGKQVQLHPRIWGFSHIFNSINCPQIEKKNPLNPIITMPLTSNDFSWPSYFNQPFITQSHV
jgi:hypothetical protein